MAENRVSAKRFFLGGLLRDGGGCEGAADFFDIRLSSGCIRSGSKIRRKNSLLLFLLGDFSDAVYTSRMATACTCFSDISASAALRACPFGRFLSFDFLDWCWLPARFSMALLAAIVGTLRTCFLASEVGFALVTFPMHTLTDLAIYQRLTSRFARHRESFIRVELLWLRLRLLLIRLGRW